MVVIETQVLYADSMEFGGVPGASAASFFLVISSDFLEFWGGSCFLSNFLPVFSCYSTSGWINWCLLATPRHRRQKIMYYDDMESRNWATYTVNGHDSIELQPKKSMTFAQTFK